MRGRVPDYPKVLETQPVDQWMKAIAAIGFTGIVLDRAGYTEAERAALESQIEALAGVPTVSADGRYSFYDLRSFAADVHAQLGDDGMKALAAETLALRSRSRVPDRQRGPSRGLHIATDLRAARSACGPAEPAWARFRNWCFQESRRAGRVGRLSELVLPLSRRGRPEETAGRSTDAGATAGPARLILVNPVDDPSSAWARPTTGSTGH